MSCGSDKDASVRYLETNILVIGLFPAIHYILLTKGLAGSCELTPDVENEAAQVLERFFETFYASFVLIRPFGGK